VLADHHRLGRRHQAEHGGAPFPTEEAPHRAHALEIALIAAVDQRHEAFRQIVDIRDERDAHDQPIEAVQDERAQSRLHQQAEQKNGAKDDGEPEQIGRGRARRNVNAERGAEPGDEAADEAAGASIARHQRRTHAVTNTVTAIGRRARTPARRVRKMRPKPCPPAMD